MIQSIGLMQVARSASSSTMDVAARRPRPLTGSLSRALADSDTTRDRPETPESAGAVAAIQGERPTFSIKLSRPSLVYFDNDLIEGNLVIDCASEVVIPKLTVALVCRLVVRDVLAPDLKTAHTLYKTSKIIARDLFCEPGQLQLPISFAVPSQEPASFEMKGCSVRWDVRLLQQSSGRRFHTITRGTFRKACIYRPLPGFKPKAQSEGYFMLQKSKPFRVEASLDKDVCAAEDPVEVEVTVHNASLVVRCKKITATVLQYADGWVGGHSVFRRVTVLDKSTHVPQKWTKARVVESDGQDAGTMYTRKFAMLPRPDAARKCAVQKILAEGIPEDEARVVLAPSAECAKKEGTMWISIKYAVVIDCKLFGADDLSVSLPLTIMSPVSDSEPLPESHVEDFLVFPPVDPPPSYYGLRRNSRSSYSSLQRAGEEGSLLSLAAPGSTVSLDDNGAGQLAAARRHSAPLQSLSRRSESQPSLSRSSSLRGSRRLSSGTSGETDSSESGFQSNRRRSVSGLLPTPSMELTQSVIDELSDEEAPRPTAGSPGCDSPPPPPEFDQEWSYEYQLSLARNRVRLHSRRQSEPSLLRAAALS